MARRSFEVVAWRRHGRWMLRLFVVVPFGIAGLASGDVEGGAVVAGAALLAWGLATTVYEVFYRPCLVTLTDAGVLLEAAARYRFIAWNDLGSVRRLVRRYGDYLVWRTREGRRLATLYGITDRTDMKTTISVRAPHAKLDGW